MVRGDGRQRRGPRRRAAARDAPLPPGAAAPRADRGSAPLRAREAHRGRRRGRAREHRALSGPQPAGHRAARQLDPSGVCHAAGRQPRPRACRGPGPQSARGRPSRVRAPRDAAWLGGPARRLGAHPRLRQGAQVSRARPTRRLRAALAVLALGLGAGCVLGRLYREPLPPEAELFDATTADGWRLGIIRYRPERPRGLPVLLCHGVFNNGRILDIDAEHSLARWLASRGRDTYLLNLRGTRYSDQPDPQAGRSLRYSADTYVLQDMPAAIEAIRRRTGAPKVDLVGHSMGGHLAYIYVAERPEDVNAVVTLGASAHFHGVGKIERESGRSIARLGTSLGPTVPAPEIAHVFAPLHGE
ncbi:MAG TPA: hypothetical protein DFS52_08535, partial [Myxococcales bacterium]|nr:hypothetical protein [Myxococcales bacterium]